MRTILVLVSLILVWGCASSIPLTQLEKTEYQKAVMENPDSMDFYVEMQQSAGRTPISVRIVKAQPSDVFFSEMVKSRRTFSGWTRFKRFLLSREIKREELDIRINLY